MEPSAKVTVYRGWLEPGRYVWSPFVTKLELRLRASNILYSTEAGSLSTAPKGKIPYLELQTDDASSLLYSDSTLIVKDLIDAGLLPDWNSSLDESTRLSDLAVRALLEDKLYFYHTRERWLDNYYAQRDGALWSISYPVRIIIGLLIHRKIKAMLHGQGTGRFTEDEIRASRREIWETLAKMLEHSSHQSRRRMSKGGPFWLLGGFGPSEADTTLYGFIVSVLIATSGPESRELVSSFPIIIDYADRIHMKYFPDYEKWT